VALVGLSATAVFAAPDPPSGSPSAVEALAEALTTAPAAERESLLGTDASLHTPALVQALVARADALRVKGEFGRALDLFQFALALSTRIGDLPGQAAALRGQGIVHTVRGDLRLAEETFRRSLAVAESAGDKPAIARVLSNLGTVLNQEGNYALAIEHHKRSAALLEELGDTRMLAGPLGNLAIVSTQVGNSEEALEYARRALALSQAAGNKVWTARIYNIIANVHESLGDYAGALENFARSLALAEEAGDRVQVAGVTANIGSIYRFQGDAALARQHYERSLALFEALGSKAEAARTLIRLAVLDEEQGDYVRSLEESQKSLAVFEALNDSLGTFGARHQLGAVYRRMGKLDLALEHYGKSLAGAESGGAREEMVESLVGMAQVHLDQGHPTEAAALAGRSADLARGSGHRQGLWQSCLTLARARRALGQIPDAREALQEAIATVEVMRAQAAGGEIEQQRVLESRLEPYRLLLDIELDEGDTRAAFALSERTKARVLADVLAGGRVHLSKAMSAAEKQDERRLNAEIVSLNVLLGRERASSAANAARLSELEASLQKVRLEHEAYLVGLYSAHPELRVQRGDLPTIDVQQTADLMAEPGVALLEYALTDAGVYLLAVTEEDGAAVLRSYRLDSTPAQLARRCRQFREQLAARDLDFTRAARALYDLLLGPAAAQLRGRTRLVIVPDGPLWELPFQALRSPAGRALIADDAISYAPSLTVLRAMSRSAARATAGPPRLLAFGNPALPGPAVRRAAEVLMGEPLAPLPEAERQVRALGRLYGAGRSAVYVGSQASEDRVKAETSRFQILHVATHGILDDRSPMYSDVVLAPAPAGKEDGLLEAREIMDLDLHADLAVLSACESGRGRLGAGEGIIGLTWAFFVAGCPATVASQWKVESASTPELMLEFHRRLAAGDDKARALQRASLKLSRSQRYKHPFYWAGFVVMGDPR
jgi:CHAT domain-containing protein/tetratricopeptide (TPR) repeat protein